ncbi:MAG: DEAD/DEAH box helicase [Bacteroidetes bacterium]|nr:DEAD/DEAH box helicase [Bacteroidota bacterium]NOG58203.1 DEAD/DEAH box helicase [Bacteroidota bacterium]
MTFNDFGFGQEIMEGLDAMGFKEPTPVQEQSIPAIQARKDIIAVAQTGTGKTAAYLLPILDRILKNGPGKLNTLIIAPTRELAMQIDQQMEGFSYFTGTSCIAVYGGGSGTSFEAEKTALIEGADVIVATPGRLLSHLNLKYAKLEHLEHFILDEADRMLDMGFSDDINKIAEYLPKKRQNIMFSATMPPKIRSLAKKIMINPTEVNIAISQTAEGIIQAAYCVYDAQKNNLLKSLLKGKDELNSIIVFTSRKATVKDIVRDLKKMGMDADGISSDLDQGGREEVLRRFRNKRLRILVATDIISRGIDIDSIDLVINFDVPNDPEDYVHRVGRTARAKSSGIALTFINDKDQRDFLKIEQLIKKDINKLANPDDIGEGPAYKPSSQKPQFKKSFKPRYNKKKQGK